MAAGSLRQAVVSYSRPSSRFFFGQAAGLGFHPLFQRAVEVLQVIGHVIEAQGQITEFVLAHHRQAHAEIALGHALHAGLQAPHRADHQGLEEAHQNRRADHRQAHQAHLQGAQHVGVVGVVDLHLEHQLVDQGHEAVDLLAQHRLLACQLARRRISRHGQGHGLDAAFPGVGNGLQAGADGRVLRYPQGALGVALLQAMQHPVEFADLAAHRAGIGLCLRQGVGDAVGTHAFAAGVVDGRRRAFQLPGHVQGHAHGGQRHQEENGEHAEDLGTELPFPGLEVHRGFHGVTGMQLSGIRAAKPMPWIKTRRLQKNGLPKLGRPKRRRCSFRDVRCAQQRPPQGRYALTLGQALRFCRTI
jgi:hypothetical protein